MEQVEPVPVQQSNGMAVAGMVLGICSLLFGLFVGILAIIFSALALKKRQTKGIAVAGLVTGIVGTVFGTLFLILIVFGVAAGVQMGTQDASVAAQAETLLKKAEAYNVTSNEYPNYEQMEVLAKESNITISMEVTDDSADIIYIPCYGEGSIIWYWSIEDDEYLELRAGYPSDCEWRE